MYSASRLYPSSSSSTSRHRHHSEKEPHDSEIPAPRKQSVILHHNSIPRDSETTAWLKGIRKSVASTTMHFRTSPREARGTQGARPTFRPDSFNSHLSATSTSTTTSSTSAETTSSSFRTLLSSASTTTSHRNHKFLSKVKQFFLSTTTATSSSSSRSKNKSSATQAVLGPMANIMRTVSRKPSTLDFRCVGLGGHGMGMGEGGSRWDLTGLGGERRGSVPRLDVEIPQEEAWFEDMF